MRLAQDILGTKGVNMKLTKTEKEWQEFCQWAEEQGLQERMQYFTDNFITDGGVNTSALLEAFIHGNFIQIDLLCMGRGEILEDENE